MTWNLVNGLLLLVLVFFATGAALRTLPRPLPPLPLPARWSQAPRAPVPPRGPAPAGAAPAAPALVGPPSWGASLALAVSIATSVLVGGLMVGPCVGGGCDLRPNVRAIERQTVFLDRNGVLIGPSGGSPRLPYEEMPGDLTALAVTVEDRRFWSNPCVDPIGVVRAALANLRGRREGASTICMQAARALDRDGRMPPDGTWRGKGAETVAAVRLLLHTRSRKRVLALYLNTVYLGNGHTGVALEGVEAAARYYFGKPAAELSLAQAATLVGIIQAPMRYHPVRNPRAARERRDRVLRMLAEQRPEYAARVQAALAEPLGTRIGRASASQYLAGRLDDYIPEGQGAVRTTLHTPLQAAAEREAVRLARGIQRKRGRRSANPVSSGILVMNADGELLAYACGTPMGGSALGGWDPCGKGRIALASTLKIWLMAFALDRGVVREDERLSSISARLGGVHRRGEFRTRQCPAGEMNLTVRQAFAVSSNCLAVLLLAALPEDARSDLARMEIPVDPANPMTALGMQTLPIPVLLSYVAALANGGRVPTPVLAPDASVSTPPVDSLPLRASTRDRMRSLMRDVVVRGTARLARGQLAGLGGFAKTGTNENLDVRIVGGVENGAVGIVWLGHPKPAPLLHDLDAGRMLAVSWSRMMAVAARQP